MTKSRWRSVLGALMVCLCFFKGAMYLAALLSTHPGSRKVVSALMAEEKGGQVSNGPTDIRLRMLEKYVLVSEDATRKQAICDGGICLTLFVFYFRKKRTSSRKIGVVSGQTDKRENAGNEGALK